MPSRDRIPADAPDASDLLTDALLREHARLGNLDDEGLLASIRARTVARPVVAVGVPAPRLLPRTSRREWLQVAAIVALSLTVLALFLSQRSVDRLSASRAVSSHRLVNLSPAPVTARVQADQPEAAAPGASLAETHPGFVADPEIRSLRLDAFSVSAQSQSHLASGWLVYEGEVVLRHPDFTLTADRLELASRGAGADAPVNAFVARGPGVRIEKRSAAGTIEVARADRATYDPEGGRLILAGGPTLSAGNSFVQPLTAGGVIVLRADGYEVIERQAR